MVIANFTNLKTKDKDQTKVIYVGMKLMNEIIRKLNRDPDHFNLNTQENPREIRIQLRNLVDEILNLNHRLYLMIKKHHHYSYQTGK